jgi:hypothetical protein
MAKRLTLRFSEQRPLMDPHIALEVGVDILDRVVLRMLVAVLCCAGWSVLVAGCGAGVSHAGDAAHYGKSREVDRERIRAYAHTINLGATDVPGMTGRGQEGEFDGQPFSAGVERCGGYMVRGGESDSVISPTFIRQPIHERKVGPGMTVIVAPTEGIYSAVYAMPNATLAQQTAEAAGSARTRACLQLLRDAHPAKFAGKPYGEIKISALRLQLRETRLYGLREGGTLPATFGDGRKGSHFYVDIVGFVSGRSDIILRMRSTPHPIPVATERQLIALLASRAKTHRL